MAKNRLWPHALSRLIAVVSPVSAVRRWLGRARQLAQWDLGYQRRQHGQRRLTVVSQYFPPDFAATGQLLDDLTSRLADDGLQVQVLTGMPAYAFQTGEADPIEFQPRRVIIRSRASRFWPKRIRGRAVNGLLFCVRTALRLLKYSRRGDLLVYTTEPPYLPVFGWLVHCVTRTPYALILYDLYPDVLVQLGVLQERHAFTRFWRQCNRYAYGAARDLVVLSEPMRRRVVFFVPEVADRLSVIPSWADTDLIRPLPRQQNWFVQRYALEHTFNVLYSGNQGRCHDLVTLMGAAMLLRDQSDVRFLFIGAGPQHQRIRDLAADWGLTNCMFLPYQEYDVLPFSLSSADLAVVSLGITAVGLVAPSKLYGHLAAGTPLAVISPADSDLRDLVDDQLGAWFANGDGSGLAHFIQTLRSDPQQRAGFSRRCRDLAEQTYSGVAVARRYAQLFNAETPLVE